MKARRVIRWCVSLVVMAAVAVGGYAYVHHQTSDRVRAEMLRVVDDMTLPADSREEIRRRLATAHNQAFNDALNVTRGHGNKFDHEAYFKQVFDTVIAGYRAEGRADLADSLDEQRGYFSFDVTER